MRSGPGPSVLPPWEPRDSSARAVAFTMSYPASWTGAGSSPLATRRFSPGFGPSPIDRWAEGSPTAPSGCPDGQSMSPPPLRRLHCLMSSHFHLPLEVPDRESHAPLDEEGLPAVLPMLYGGACVRNCSAPARPGTSAGTTKSSTATKAGAATSPSSIGKCSCAPAGPPEGRYRHGGSEPARTPNFVILKRGVRLRREPVPRGNLPRSPVPSPPASSSEPRPGGREAWERKAG